MPLRYRLLVWLIVRAIENSDYVWILAKVVRYVALNLQLDEEAKTWRISSGPMPDMSWQRLDYSDIDAIFRAKPSGYRTTEEFYPDGKFKRFTVSTN